MAAHPSLPTAGTVWVLLSPNRRQAVGPYSGAAAEGRRESRTEPFLWSEAEATLLKLSPGRE